MTSKASQTTLMTTATPARNAAGEGSMGDCTCFEGARGRQKPRTFAGGRAKPGEEPLQLASLALTVISALKSLDTGQPVSAALTAASNLALSAPGISAIRSRWLLVTENPSPTF